MAWSDPEHTGPDSTLLISGIRTRGEEEQNPKEPKIPSLSSPSSKPGVFSRSKPKSCAGLLWRPHLHNFSGTGKSAYPALTFMFFFSPSNLTHRKNIHTPGTNGMGVGKCGKKMPFFQAVTQISQQTNPNSARRLHLHTNSVFVFLWSCSSSVSPFFLFNISVFEGFFFPIPMRQWD